MKKTFLSFALLAGSLEFSFGTPFTIAATSEIPFADNEGSFLANGSILQVGYFNVDSAVLPLSYDQSIWDTFTPILGVASLNPGKVPSNVTIQDFGPPFPANFDFSVGFDTETDTLADAVGKRLGIRVFDNTNLSATSTDLRGSDFNTFSSSNPSWILPGESGGSILSPALIIQDDPASTATLSWEFGPTSEFRTVVPEPSSSLALLLGTGLILLRRGRRQA